MQYHMNLKDIIHMGYMFRTNILAFLGIKETIKISRLSILTNRITDYNKHTRDIKLSYLQEIMMNEIPV